MTTVLAVLLAVATVVAVARLVAAPTPSTWRRAALIALQPVASALLYLTLVPPPGHDARSVLVVITRGGAPVAGARNVALPEAAVARGTPRIPDLATALRRFAPARLRVVGAGLTARDRDAVRGLPIDFDPPPLPPGVTALSPPAPVAAGAAFRIGGTVTTPAHATVELVDPGGHRVDSTTTDAAGYFALSATARTPGPALFTVRVRDGARKVDEASVPVVTTPAEPVRLLLLAGAPGPEVKYLRRWASEAGLTVRVEIATGAGLQLGDAPLPLTAATLRGFDLVIADDRSWTALAADQRAAVRAAVRGGLGLIVRIDGPPNAAARAALAGLGFTVTAPGEATPVTLPAAADDAAQAARIGPGTADDPATINRGAALPPLTRWATVGGAGTTPLLRDNRGTPLAAWRGEGAGRIALWPLTDAFRLVLAGRGDVFGGLWSAAATTIARGRSVVEPSLDGPAWAGQRAVLCRVGKDAVVVDPQGRRTALLRDARGCAAFWPAEAGWHRVVAGTTVPFYVAAADALPGVRATADRDATLALAGAPAAAGATGTIIPGSPWPWFAAWLAACALLWWLERSRTFARRHSA